MKYTISTDKYYNAKILASVANFLENKNYLGDYLVSLSDLVSETSPYIGMHVGNKVFAPSSALDEEFILRTADEMREDINLIINVLERLRARIDETSRKHAASGDGKAPDAE